MPINTTLLMRWGAPAVAPNNPSKTVLVHDFIGAHTAEQAHLARGTKSTAHGATHFEDTQMVHCPPIFHKYGFPLIVFQGQHGLMRVAFFTEKTSLFLKLIQGSSSCKHSRRAWAGNSLPPRHGIEVEKRASSTCFQRNAGSLGKSSLKRRLRKGFITA